MRKLRKGVHWVRIPHMGRRKVKVLANGRWRFLSMGRSSKKRHSKRYKWVKRYY